MTLQCSGTRRREQIDQYPGMATSVRAVRFSSLLRGTHDLTVINAPWGEGAMCVSHGSPGA